MAARRDYVTTGSKEFPVKQSPANVIQNSKAGLKVVNISNYIFSTWKHIMVWNTHIKTFKPTNISWVRMLAFKWECDRTSTWEGLRCHKSSSWGAQQTVWGLPENSLDWSSGRWSRVPGGDCWCLASLQLEWSLTSKLSAISKVIQVS